MKVGDTWHGHDGTAYRVIGVGAVTPDQPRWWVDEVPLPGDRMCGPATPDRLHLLPASLIPRDDNKRSRVHFALVLP